MTGPVKKRGRPRKEIKFLNDPEANARWNAERGPKKRQKSHLHIVMSGSYKLVKEQLCSSWGASLTKSHEFVSELEYYQEDLPKDLLNKLRSARDEANRIRTNGAAERSEAATNEYRHLMSHKKVRPLIQSVKEKRLSARSAAYMITKNWQSLELDMTCPSDRKLRGWIAKAIK